MGLGCLINASGSGWRMRSCLMAIALAAAGIGLPVGAAATSGLTAHLVAYEPGENQFTSATVAVGADSSVSQIGIGGTSNASAAIARISGVGYAFGLHADTNYAGAAELINAAKATVDATFVVDSPGLTGQTGYFQIVGRMPADVAVNAPGRSTIAWADATLNYPLLGVDSEAVILRQVGSLAKTQDLGPFPYTGSFEVQFTFGQPFSYSMTLVTQVASADGLSTADFYAGNYQIKRPNGDILPLVTGQIAGLPEVASDLGPEGELPAASVRYYAPGEIYDGALAVAGIDPIPEPVALAPLGIGLMYLFAHRRWKKSDRTA